MSNDEYQTRDFWKNRIPIIRVQWYSKLIPTDEVKIYKLGEPKKELDEQTKNTK